MSTQAGIWNFDGKSVDRAFLGKLSSAIKQSGSDSVDMYSDRSLGMVYRAFHTTPESCIEHQPYSSRRGNVITWDGRLDNRDELTNQLQVELASEQTDVAIVMAAYEKWGTDCFSKLIGDWAMCIWDRHQQQFLLARDFAGIRHLYYYPCRTSILWCTTLAPLVLLSGAPLTLNDDYIAGYLALYPAGHLTPYREIHSVQGGHFLLIRAGKSTLRRYWALDPARRIRYKTDAEYEEHFRQVFREAVRRRLRSVSPVLAELSGGLDSSSIVCMADDINASAHPSTPRIDTISFYNTKEPGGDERPYFSKVEEKRGQVGFHFDVGKDQGAWLLQTRNFAAIPGYLGAQNVLDEVSTFKRVQGYRVLLSGIGGDEFLGGIPDPRPQLGDLVMQLRLFELARQLKAWSLAKRRPLIHIFYQSVLQMLPSVVRIRLSSQFKAEPWIHPQFVRQYLLSKNQLEGSNDFHQLPTRRDFARTLEIMSRQMGQTQPNSWECEEKRYPYLDQNLLEFLAAVPPEQLLRPGDRRSLMRRALVGLLPKEILLRPTKAVTARSYMLALDVQWLEIERIFKSSLVSRCGYIAEGDFLKALRETRNGSLSHLIPLLRGVSLECWLRDMDTRGVISAQHSLPQVRPIQGGSAPVQGHRRSECAICPKAH